MKRKALYTLLFSTSLIGCAGTAEKQKSQTITSAPIQQVNVVPWEQALIVLRKGDVLSLMQSHDLHVQLMLSDGKKITTVQPKIDAIFDEVKQCGHVCESIALATE